MVEYDRGEKGGERRFVPADRCLETPCIVTQWGAIRFPPGIEKTHQVRLGALHRGVFHPILLFQESTTLEQKLSGRILNRKPNRKIVNLEDLITKGGTNTIFMYGLLLQEDLDEGDVLALQLVSVKKPSEVRDYYFRYHHTGVQFDVDLAFVQPINTFHPNPGGAIQAAYSTAALSFSFGGSMDPERRYHLLGKITRAVRFNLMAGLLLRRDVVAVNGDNITKDYFDGFGGAGLTFFDFLAVGYGGNFVRSPHTTFPFVGLELRHFLEFLRSLKKDTHTRWRRYLAEEMAKSPPAMLE